MHYNPGLRSYIMCACIKSPPQVWYMKMSARILHAFNTRIAFTEIQGHQSIQHECDPDVPDGTSYCTNNHLNTITNISPGYSSKILYCCSSCE